MKPYQIFSLIFQKKENVGDSSYDTSSVCDLPKGWVNLRTIFSSPALPSYENRLTTAGARGGLKLIGFSSLVNTPKGRQLSTALA